ncbi:hypothetical protein ACFR99_01520 [Haloarchaeobius amylolyticus]|uniref:Restriction endonuclease n=1 Tax=Haloarchaeobius amylolyticus TaxID=1198296 RepID=A0ABD6BBZ5_9EURY
MRILVKGDSLPNIDCDESDWNESANIKDYDTVFVNLNTLIQQAGTLVHPDSSVPQSVEFPDAEDIVKLLESGNKMYVVLPDTRCTDLLMVEDGGETSEEELDLLSWLPFSVKTFEESGVSVKNGSVSKRWSWYFDRDFDWPMYLKTVSLKEDDLYVGQTPLDSATQYTVAETTFEENIASRVSIKHVSDIVEVLDGGTERKFSGSVYLLPLKPGYSFSELASEVLSNIHGLSVEPQESVPDWTENYRLPRQKKIVEEYRELQDEYEQLERYQKLLYSTGEELEQVVLEAFEELGFETEPEISGRRDGLVRVDDTVFVLETHGTKNAIGINKVDQLNRWVREAEDEFSDDTRVEGLLVANAYRQKPPEARDEGIVGDPEDHLKSYGHKVLDTTDIYDAIAGKQRGNSSHGEIREELLKSEFKVDF